MPWKECNIVEERLRFIARLLDGEKMAGLCGDQLGAETEMPVSEMKHTRKPRFAAPYGVFRRKDPLSPKS